MLLHRQSEDRRSVLNTAREDLARRFGACCRPGSAAGFVNPVLDKLGRLQEFRDEGKCDVLFQSGPAALGYQKSVVECLGVQNFEQLQVIVEDVIEDIEARRSADIDGTNEVTAFLQELQYMVFEIEADMKEPDMHFKAAP